jgi:hypothetical protein
MDELTLLTLVIAMGTIVLAYFSASSWRSKKEKRRLLRYRELHGEYLRVSNIIEVIRRPDYLRTDYRDLSVFVDSFSLHIRQSDFDAIDLIVRRNNPLIEPHTYYAWGQVVDPVSRKRSRYPSGTVVWEVRRIAFEDFAKDVNRTLDETANALRESS